MTHVLRPPGRHRVTLLILLVSAAFAALAAVPEASQAAPCTVPVVNKVACENTKAGADPSTWQVEGSGDPSIQGFPTKMSVQPGETVGFKIKAPNSSYRIDILRLGYYGGDGARIWASNIAPTGSSNQPNCISTPTTGLIDCGNWSTSYTWTVPSDAVSGVYVAHLRRLDADADSQIMFVVRDDSSRSDIVVQTSDETWQAYNSYGGNSLYVCTIDCPPGNPAAYKSAFKVSYNRPLDTESLNPRSAFFNGGEYPMVRFLEAQGYNVSYMSGLDVETRGSLLRNHKLFISSGHDEYWSANQRANVESARDAGLNLAFFSGNEVFWRTRWEPSIDGSNTANRTLVSYKDTHFQAPTDPVSWTGTWVDSRFTPASTNTPQNSLTGQLFLVNSGTSEIKVPATYAKLRFWRNTPVAGLTGSQTATLAGSTLGYEWDVDVDNGYRPAGQFRLSQTTTSDNEVFTDYGSDTLQNQTATHNLTMYKAASGALVFGAGTVQWSWGLDDMNAGYSTPNLSQRQATVNLFADMSVQPTTLQTSTGLQAATKSTDTAAPTAALTSPPSSVSDGTKVTLTGTAADTGGGVVAGVEVSTDGGATWHPATGTTSWTYSWIAHGSPSTTVKVRASDDSGNIGTPTAGTSVTVNCPCSIWGTGLTPEKINSSDNTPVEVGVKFRADTYGLITGVRFYKASNNTGTHSGSLWSSSGQRLAQATFQNETATGWQTVTFANPVPVLPGQTYVASYYAPNGGYAATSDYFWRSPSPGPLGGAIVDGSPLHAVRNTGTETNGVYTYAGASTFPTSAYNAGNYWVDVTYQTVPPAGTVTNVSATAGRASATLSWNAPSSGGGPTEYVVTPYIGSQAQQSTTLTGTPPQTGTTIKNLTPNATYTFRVQAKNPNGAGPQSAASNAVTVQAPIAPTAPTGVSAEPASGSARVSWTAPASDGGSDITGYSVTPYLNGAAQTPVSASASATGLTLDDLVNGSSYRFTVTATNAVGSTASAQTAAVVPQNMLFDLQTPQIPDSGDGSPVELGVKFRSDSYGVVNGLRFYKSSANTGTHVGSLWTAGGALLARATFTNESATGWQSVTFDQPVEIHSDTTYVASYNAPNGRYAYTSSAFGSAVDNPPLHTIANSVSANGVYAYSGTPTFPRDTYQAANYWVDVMFMPTPPPGAVTNVSATAGRASATVSWTAPSSGGDATSYVVTPYIGSNAQTPTTVTGSPPAATATIKGLTPGTAYTFRVRAANPNGSSPLSGASNSVTPLSPIAPSGPTGVAAEPATGQARISWTAPDSDGGSALTGYTVTPYTGGVAQPATHVAADKTKVTVDSLTNGVSYRFRVTATNAIGSTQSGDSPEVTPRNTIFELDAPDDADSGDNSGVEVGVKFRADVEGWVRGLRFYKLAGNTGTHVGSLWDANGSLLARATFTGESATGWQSVTFDSRVRITPGTTYLASYYAPNGRYTVSLDGLASGQVNGPLRALADSTSANGVYAYHSAPTFPTSSFRASNYWVDVFFEPEAPPGQVTDVAATAQQGGATVSWTPPTTGGTPTSYVVTPYIGGTAQTAKTITGSPLATSTSVSGLTSGTAYTFRVRAANANGSGPLSAASNAVTPTGTAAPGAPTSVTAVAANGSARVSWTPPASDGGSAITGYSIRPYVGSTAQTPVSAGVGATSATVNGLTNGTPYRFSVSATNGVGSTESPQTSAVTPQYTLFALGTPTTVDAGDGDAVELGVKFTASTAGSLTGLRFYKAATNTGTHVGTLWTLGGSQLARATYTGETASGWQTVQFATPVPITAGTTYVASVFAPNGHYSVSGNAFGSPFANPPLQAPASVTTPNGVYAYTGSPTFPTNSFNSANYWVDVTFMPTGGQ